MRCLCCDVNLSDAESTRKHLITGAFLDTCNRCMKAIEEDLGFNIATPVNELEDALGEEEDG